MKDYSGIKYNNAFLNQVIIRMDFLQYLETEKLFNDDTEKVILKMFPRRGMDQRIHFNTINVVIDPNKTNTPSTQKETLEGIQREYYSGKNKILLTNKFLVLDINEYDTFDQHYQCIQTILSALYSKQKITSARIGIRYINIFAAENLRLRKNMFSSEISAALSAKEDASDIGLRLTRAMSLKEYQLGNMVLNFRYGMFNPDYPNPLTKDSFSLDYDCFTTEPIDSMNDVLRIINQGHDAIQELFEASITDSLRKVLINE